MHKSVAHPNWRVERTARGENPRAWEQALRSFDPDEAGVIKEDRRTAVYRATLLGRDVVLKRWDLATLGSRLRSLIRAGQADRHWRGAGWLVANGIQTARCLALATEQRRPCPRRWLVMERVPGRSLLEHLANGGLSVGEEHLIARAVGRQVEQFGSAILFNRDHKPSNLIVTGDAANPAIVVIDCVGIRFYTDDPERMLASLAIEPLGCGVPPRAALAMRVIRAYIDAPLAAMGREIPRPRTRTSRNRVWHEVSAIIRRHGDPRPRINPLAGSALNSP